MNHQGTKRIETKRLILRPFIREDAQAMYRNWASDPQVTRYLTWPSYESLENAHGILKIWTEAYAKPDFYQWAVEWKETAEPIGSISVVNYNEKTASAEVGYCIGRLWWGKGIMAEALNAVMEYLFREVGVNRIEARHAAENRNSGKVMEKCGMHYEGTLRQADWCNAGVCDMRVYSILKKEYNLG